MGMIKISTSFPQWDGLPCSGIRIHNVCIFQPDIKQSHGFEVSIYQQREEAKRGGLFQ